MGTDGSTGRPGSWYRGKRSPEAVIEQRVSQIYGWLIAGQRTSAIYRLAAEAQKVERERRAAAASGALDRAGKPLDAPHYVWGDGDMPTRRALDRYIRKAKQRLQAEGRELSHSGVMALGWTWARLNDLYWRALSDKRYTVCARLIDSTMELFGLKGAIKVQLVPPGGESGNGGGDGRDGVPEIGLTEEQLMREWQEIVNIGLARVRGTAPGVPLFPSAPVAVIPPPPKAKPNGARGDGNSQDSQDSRDSQDSQGSDGSHNGGQE